MDELLVLLGMKAKYVSRISGLKYSIERDKTGGRGSAGGIRIKTCHQ